MTTQSIIVYRNPLEAAMWESGVIFPVMASCALFLASFLVINLLLDKVCSKNWNRGYNTYIAGVVALGLFCWNIDRMIL